VSAPVSVPVSAPGDPSRLIAEAERLESEAAVHTRAAAQLRRLAAGVRREHAARLVPQVCGAPHPDDPGTTCRLSPHRPGVEHDASAVLGGPL
jgi:hypothetical protein